MPPVLARLIPAVQLSEVAFRSRHRALRAILWLHIPLVAGVAVLGGHGGGHADGMHGQHGEGATFLWVVIAAAAGCAVLSMTARGRRTRAVAVSVGLLLSAVALVHGGGGLTDLHFHFFVVLALISLYQDWAPFGVAVLLVAAHHLGMGLLAPTQVFSDPRAQQNPLPWALLHATFVIAMCGAQMAYWRFSAVAQEESERIRERISAETEGSLRAAATEAADAASRSPPRRAPRSSSAAPSSPPGSKRSSRRSPRRAYGSPRTPARRCRRWRTGSARRPASWPPRPARPVPR